MDNLTHTAIGLFLSRAGLKDWTPRATPILLLAANAPDIDVLSATRGSLNYLHYHRHWTHTWAALPFIALLPVIVVALVSRKPLNFGKAFLASCIGVASHSLLDLTNIYGVRMLLPFSEAWLHLDITNVVDLWIWVVAVLAILGPLIARLVGSEITSGTMRARHHGRGFAWFALIFLLLYSGGRAVLHARAVTVLESRIYQGAEPIRVAAFPDSVNPFRWAGLVETRDFWAWAPVDLLGEFDPTRAGTLHKATPDPAIDAARATPVFQEFLKFSLFPLWRVTPVSEPANGKSVQVIDLRFGNPMSPGFTATATVNNQMQVIDASFHFRPRPR